MRIVTELCSLSVDLNPLLPFKKKLGTLGYYHQADFDIYVNFGPELWYGLVRDERIIGSMTAKYV